MSAIKGHLQIRGFEKFQQRLHPENPKATSKPVEDAKEKVATILDQPLEFVELPSVKFARLPL